MTEPLLLIGALFLAFIAGLIGGFFLGWREGKTTSLLVKQIERIHNLFSEISKGGTL